MFLDSQQHSGKTGRFYPESIPMKTIFSLQPTTSALQTITPAVQETTPLLT
jgi:hypothetical protein